MSDDPFDPDFLNISRYHTRYDDTGTPDPDDPFSLSEDDSQSDTVPPSSPGSSAPDSFGSILDSDHELVDSEPGRALSSLSDYPPPESSYYYGVPSSFPAVPAPPSPPAGPDSLLQPSYSDFKSTPVKPTLSATNSNAFQPKTGKARGPGLVGNEVGMAPRFRQQCKDEFVGEIPGQPPTSGQISAFYAPATFDHVKNEKQCYPELVNYFLVRLGLLTLTNLDRPRQQTLCSEQPAALIFAS